MKIRPYVTFVLLSCFLTFRGWCLDHLQDDGPDSSKIASFELLPDQNQNALKTWESERLTYKLAMTDQEIEDTFHLMKNPKINIYLFADGTISEHQISYFLYNFSADNKFFSQTKQLAGQLLWNVYRKEDHKFVGIISGQHVNPYYPIAIPTEGEIGNFYRKDVQKHTYLNMAYAVAPDFQGNGYSKEMTLSFIEELFQHTTIEVVIHSSDPKNEYSARSAITCGFMEKGMITENNAAPETFRIMRKSSQIFEKK
ncbi:MAG TPA: GNAT family N-acetyltransferase [Candidatus Nitrosotenuis sp.]|jgi:RimJ/RimL family protein N-acetyltransferase|nr:GNAT family N-acetyltransferase [Candidatus Nitrosotenuis sp.]